MNDSSRSITEHRSGVRAGLLALAVPIVLVGGWALLAPHGWYATFPGGGRHWVSALGPYDEHLVRDFGGTYLGLGLLLGAAALLLDRLVVQVALATSLVFQVPHLIFHLGETGPLSTGDNVVNLVLLAAGIALTVMLLAATRAPRAGGVREAQPIEGGISYGTH